MKQLFFLFISIFLLTHCKQETKISTQNSTILSKNAQFSEEGDKTIININKFRYEFSKNELPLKKIVLLNSSLLGYFLEINAEENIVAVSSPEYIYSEKIVEKLQQGTIQEVGNEQKYNVEKIIALKPDAIFTNYVTNFENTYQLLKNNGIKVIFVDEYLEQNPLEKASYIKLFGKLIGKEEAAHKKYQDIEKDYIELKKIASKSSVKPNVLSNEMYGDIWYMPGGKTYTANYLADANANYILKDNSDDKAVNMSFEEVFVKSSQANIWVNAGIYDTKNDLLKSNSFYNKLEIVKNGKIFVLNGRKKNKSNDFFESGVVRADLVLKDYIKIFHPDLLPQYQLTYMMELQ